MIEDLERYRSHFKNNLIERRPSHISKDDAQKLVLAANQNSTINELLKRTIIGDLESGKCHIDKVDILTKLAKKIKYRKKRTMSMCADKKYAKTLLEYQERVFNGSPTITSKNQTTTKKPLKHVVIF